jgi:predicted nuclease of restriction endonuclease-like (RecB) superfamily
MRQFYGVFEKSQALRGELSWTHYRLLLKVERSNARAFYTQEAIACQWSTRTLERQINCLYFERMAMTKTTDGEALVKAEITKERELLEMEKKLKK